ncbi:MAG: hypothetical protein FWF53_12745 [Candidatus Azobacteroides sp.]|nr:hypothetical protein [Candidatus Azobacteroides sp.]
MVHTVHLDDEYINVKKLLEEIYRQKEGVRFENPTANDAVPEGYMTSDEFRKQAIIKVNTFCDKHGIL